MQLFKKLLYCYENIVIFEFYYLYIMSIQSQQEPLLWFYINLFNIHTLLYFMYEYLI